jgi:MYXO-CTERM domain-containing protein
MTKGAKVIQVLASVEEGTHKTFTSELLICDFTRRSLEGNYSYTAVYSIPLDEWNPDKACVDAPENQDCYIVNGGATFKHLSGTSESALLDQVGGILTDNYDGGLLDDVHEDLLGLDFVSFVEETISGNDTSGNDDPAGGDGGDGANKSASSVSIGGTAAITIAAIGLVVVGLLFFRRRRTQSMYVEEFGDKGLNDTMLDDAYLPEDSSTHRAPMVTILNDELDGESTYLHLERSYDLAQFDQKMAHDPVTCNSVTCAICRKPDIALQPIFVDTGVDLALSDTGELRPEMLSLGSSERIYTVPDTVEL